MPFRGNNMKALIDGDVIVYQAGFASDQTSYLCADGYETKYKKDAVQYSKVNGCNVNAIIKNVVPEPLEYCLSSVKKMIGGIKNSIDADSHLVLLTGKGNFRHTIYPQYKANRDKAHRPHHYDAIREYLKDTWKADEVTGVEADDALGWHQFKDLSVNGDGVFDAESCVCTIDKDLNQIPGWHYNWRSDDGNGQMYWVTPAQSIRFFFEQWLTGDSADNIPGIKGVGEKTARKLLNAEFGTTDATPLEYYYFVRKQYHKKSPSVTDKFFHTIGDLLWMQRHPGETWDQYLELTTQREFEEPRRVLDAARALRTLIHET